MYSTIIAYILFFCSGFGILGLHRHYLGKHATGILWLLTGGLGTVGSWYDLFTMSSQVREANIRKAISDGSLMQRSNGTWRTADTGNTGNSWRNVDDGSVRIIRDKEPVERTILKLAKENKGVLTASDLALAANIKLEDAKRDLDAMVSKGFAELRVRQSGALVYVIPDLMDSDESFVD